MLTRRELLFSQLCVISASALSAGCEYRRMFFRAEKPIVAVVGYEQQESDGHRARLEKEFSAFSTTQVLFQSVAFGDALTVERDTSDPGYDWSRVTLAICTSGLLAASVRRLTPSLPIVFATTGDPTLDGLAVSLNRPMLNATGFTYEARIDPKRLQLLTRVCPDLRSVTLITEPFMHQVRHVADFERASAALKLAPRFVSVESFDQLTAQRTALKTHEAFVVPVSPAVDGRESDCAAMFAEIGRPVVFGFESFVQHGGLMSFDGIIKHPYSILARQAAAVVGGVNAGDIAFESPQHFRLCINLDTARLQRRDIPDELLYEADAVYDTKSRWGKRG